MAFKSKLFFKHVPNNHYVQCLTLSILMVCISTNISCQELHTNQKNIQFSFGATHYRFIDELFTQNKAKFAGTAFSPKMKYVKSAPKHIFSASLGYSQANVRNLDSEVKIQLYDLQASVSYQKVLSNSPIFNSKSKLLMGAQLSLQDYLLIEEDILENKTTAFNYTLDVLVSQNIDVNPKNRLAISLALPIAGFIKRETSDGGANQQLERDYKDNLGNFFFKDSKLQFLNPLNLTRINLDYIINPDRKTSFVISYQFNYLHNRNKSPIFLYGNYLGIGMNIELKKS